MFFNLDPENGGFYFIGIGGVSMSALAILLRGKGYRVRGSDAREGEFTRKAIAAGIPVHIGETEEIEEQTVVVTGAAENSPQALKARNDGKTILTRAELLGKVASCYPHVVSVAGCHGKTTTTSMLAHILKSAGKEFTCHIGGEDLDFGNGRDFGGDYFVTEACEFKRSFLSLGSEIGIILNVDRDHTDCYPTEEDLFLAYAEFATRCKKLIVNGDDSRARTLPHVSSFGFYEGDVRAVRLFAEGERYSFTVTERGLPLVRVRLRVVGKVNVLNALAAFAAARLFGLSAEEIKRGLESFRGVKRRFEYVGTLGGVPVVCDYAHHPREIAATLRAAQRVAAGDVQVVFQPHTYTRTRDLMREFVAALKKTERPIIYRTYAAREPFELAGSAVTLAGRLPDAIYVQSAQQLCERLLGAKLTARDLILVLGAGDIYDVATQILDG